MQIFLCVFDGSFDFLVLFLLAVHSPELSLVLNVGVVLPGPYSHIPRAPGMRDSCEFIKINNMLGYPTPIS